VAEYFAAVEETEFSGEETPAATIFKKRNIHFTPRAGA